MRTKPRGTAALACALLLLGLQLDANEGQTSATAEHRLVSVFAGGSFRSGWWSLDVDQFGRLKASVIGGDSVARQMTSVEQKRLADLLAALPTGRPKYSFGKGGVDVTTVFDLAVGGGEHIRHYFVTDMLEEDVKKPELQPILNVLHFFHGLLRSPVAIPPPPNDAE